MFIFVSLTNLYFLLINGDAVTGFRALLFILLMSLLSFITFLAYESEYKFLVKEVCFYFIVINPFIVFFRGDPMTGF